MWINFMLDLNVIFLCFRFFMIIHYIISKNNVYQRIVKAKYPFIKIDMYSFTLPLLRVCSRFKT